MASPHIGQKRLVYENQYSKIYSVNVDFGHFTKEYFVRDAGERVGVLVLQQGSVLLVRQYRLMINGLSWEVPGGKVDDGETPEEGAVRECLEETGVRCLNLRPLIFFHGGLDTTHNPTHIFRCDEIAKDHEPDRIHAQEVSGFEWVPLTRSIEMVFEGKIVDYLSIIAILSHQTLAAQDRLESVSTFDLQRNRSPFADLF